MAESLNIAIIADPALPVPPLLYGGIERIIDMLIKDLLKRGHTVSLFAHADSKTEAQLFPYPGNGVGKINYLKNTWLINKNIYRNNYDIIHSFGRLAYLLPQLTFQIPKIMSYQRKPTIRQIQIANRIAKRKTLIFTGCSNYISEQIAPFAPSYTVYNGVDFKIYDFQETVATDAPLFFLGRIEPIKGVHIAIEIAKKTKKILIIAGNIPSEYTKYFNEEIKPELNDQIIYIGAVNDIQKNELLGKASALLMPILWDEPFGIVMAEAMACGTPVIALDRGAVPEIIKDGINGFICKDIDQCVNKVIEVHNLNRSAVRNYAMTRFSAKVIAQNYLELYQEQILQATR